MFFQLACGLLSCFTVYKQPEDGKSSVKYFRFLRINFHPLEAFNISRGQFTIPFVRALAENLMSGSGDMIQDMEEMVALAHELVCSGVSTSDLIFSIVPFSFAVTTVYIPDGTNKPPERVIQVLRVAMVLIPDSRVSIALAWCLAGRFQMSHVINDYEEAIAIADKIVAAHSPGASLTPQQTQAIQLIKVLVVSRLNSHMSPEYLEDSIQRFRTLLCFPSLPDKVRTDLAVILDSYVRRRFSYFGVTGNSGETPSNTSDLSNTLIIIQRTDQRKWGVGPEDASTSQMLLKVDFLKESFTTIINGEICWSSATHDATRRTSSGGQSRAGWTGNITQLLDRSLSFSV